MNLTTFIVLFLLYFTFNCFTFTSRFIYLRFKFQTFVLYFIYFNIWYFLSCRIWKRSNDRNRSFCIKMNNYLNLLNILPYTTKKHLREIENVSNKILKRKWSKTFNNVCLKENLWPIYTKYIYIYKAWEKLLRIFRVLF